MRKRRIISNLFLFKTANSWIRAGSITVGTLLQSVNGFSTVHSNISINDTTVFVYNFTVENAHTYFVGNGEVLTHNDCNKIADIIDDLPDAPTKKAFTNALKQNQSLVEAFSNGTVRIEDWSFLVNARGVKF